ncbi:MAG: carbohydrate binding family 9 domain-containing protein [Candidatus Aminicenantes bacterium]|nr:MAG: carbohydrate binding family 9 domain-containing protein [Candidatus Aminicenantes bacterium]
MFKRFLVVIGISIVMMGTTSLLWPVELLEDGKVIIPDKVSGSITIDGELDEEVWQQPPINREFKTFFPTPGQSMGVDTKIWAAYDKGNLYFAIRCWDPEPDKIKTSVARRDTISRDDYVAILLDTLGTRQASHEFFVNPSGIQMDAVNSAVSRMDITPDFVWDSAGKIIAEGYQVEVCIPLESIRYQGSKGKTREVRMGVVFLRSVPHMGIGGAWPERQPGQTFFNVMATLIYTGLKKSGLKLEILPNFTYSRNSERMEADTWDKSMDNNIGMALKYGITSAITAEATVNPDFSQVESDVFQVEVNRRYPLFFSEKRPFFMESQEVLDFTIVHDDMASLLEYGMMVSPIHTRRILDPGWAVKFSGSSGRMNFAFLAANDRSAGRAWDVGINPNEGKSALFGIVRAKYNLGSDNSLGILYTGRHFEGQRNDVGGMDLKYRFSKHLRVGLSYFHSATRQREDTPVNEGDGWNAIVKYVSPRVIFMTSYERYDTDFFMATAFQNRVGISRFWLGIGPYINVKIKQFPWLKRIVPYFHYAHLHDLGTKMNDISRVYGLYMNFRPRSELYLEYRVEDEAWKGRLFDKNYFIALGYIQLFKWLYLNGTLYIGGQIYYDADDPFVGNDRTIDIGLTLEPGIKLKMGLNYLHSHFKDRQTHQKIYSLDIYNLHTTYQFNKYFFLRGIIRYDSLQEKLLTDFLASFTLIPGTVVHLGYGSLYLKNQWQNNMWIPGQGYLLKMKEGIFFKASYLWRIK